MNKNYNKDLPEPARQHRAGVILAGDKVVRVDAMRLSTQYGMIYAMRSYTSYLQCWTTTRAIIKLTDMKQSDIATTTFRLTAKHDSRTEEVLFFPTAHFLFFNFLPTAQVAHFVLPLTHKATQRQNKKSHFYQRFI